MKAKNENGIIKVYPNLPTAYGNVLNGYELMKERHEADGFFEVIEPNLMPNEQKGAIYFDENINAFTYPIILTPEITVEQIAIQKEQQSNDLMAEYSQKISDIVGMKEAVERYIIDYEPIPQSILDEREMLKLEYQEKLLNL